MTEHPRAILLADAPAAERGLDEIWWRGKQWAVTAYGIECLNGDYEIEADRLAEGFPEDEGGDSSDGILFDDTWAVHMAEKNWVDIDEFATAWLVALALHGTSLDALSVRKVLTRAKIENG